MCAIECCPHVLLGHDEGNVALRRTLRDRADVYVSRPRAAIVRPTVPESRMFLPAWLLIQSARSKSVLPLLTCVPKLFRMLISPEMLRGL